MSPDHRAAHPARRNLLSVGALCLLLAAGCGGGDEEPAAGGTAGPTASATATATPSPSTAAPLATEGGADDELPFAYGRPSGFIVGRKSGKVVGSLLIDRRNALLIGRFGSGSFRPAELRDTIERKLRAAGNSTPVRLERPGAIELVRIDLEDFRTADTVAGQRVAARRLYFAAGDEVWEISCQYTRARRAKVLAGCDDLAASLRPA